VSATRSKLLGLWPAGSVVAIAAWSAVTTIAATFSSISAIAPATLLAVASFSSATPVAALAPVAAASTVSGSSAITAALPAPASFAASAAPTLGELGGDAFEGAARTEQFDALVIWASAASLGGRHGGDEDAVDLEVSVGSNHISDGDAVIEQGALEDTLGLFGTGRSPGPGSVVALTRQLDLDASAHCCSGCSGGGGAPEVRGEDSAPPRSAQWSRIPVGPPGS